MSKIYTPADGYTTKSGVWIQGTDFVMMTVEERKAMYGAITNIMQVKKESGVKIPGWTKTDERVLRNAARSLGPIHRGGSNRDLTLPDLKKVWIALEKFEIPLKEQVGQAVSWPNAIIPDNYVSGEEGPYSDCTKKEVWQHMEDQRATTKAQTFLNDNKHAITDDLIPFNEVWD